MSSVSDNGEGETMERMLTDFEDEDEEPKLRYQRLGGSLTDLLKTDAATYGKRDMSESVCVCV